MTINELAVKVLSKLRVYDRNTPDSADLQNVSDAYESVYQVLSDDGLVTWVYGEDIPSRFTLSLTTLISAEIADFYHVPAPAEGWEKAKQLATIAIRRQLASSQPTETVETEYF